MLQIPEGLFPVEGIPPSIGTTAAMLGDYISLKNAQMCWVVIQYHQGDADSQTFVVYRSTVVASGGVATVTEMPIWSNLDCEASNALVRRTDAVSYAGGTGQKHKIIVFQVDPAGLGGAYDVITAGTSTAVQVTSTISVLYLIQPKNPVRVADQVSFITD